MDDLSGKEATMKELMPISRGQIMKMMKFLYTMQNKKIISDLWSRVKIAASNAG